MSEQPSRVCPHCGAEVPEHWWAMRVCPACNSSLAAAAAPAGPSEFAEQSAATGEARQQLIDSLAAMERQRAQTAERHLREGMQAGMSRAGPRFRQGPALPATALPRPVAPPAPAPAAHPVVVTPGKSKKGIIGILAAIGVILLKFKTVLLVLLGKLKFLLPALKFLKLGKILTTGGTMILSAALYATVFGWPYAVGLVLLILVHELGHMLAIWRSGLPTTAPIFIPFFGAAIFWKEMPRDAKMEATIAFGGPLLGTVGTLLCYGVYVLSGAPLWLALTYLGCFINLFNLIPILPFDGGRIMAAVSPRMWLVGMAAMVLVFIKFHSPLLLVLVLLSLPRLVEAFKRTPHGEKARYYDVPGGTRVTIAVAYCMLAGFLGYMMLHAFETLPQPDRHTSNHSRLGRGTLRLRSGQAPTPRYNPTAATATTGLLRRAWSAAAKVASGRPGWMA